MKGKLIALFIVVTFSSPSHAGWGWIEDNFVIDTIEVLWDEGGETINAGVELITDAPINILKGDVDEIGGDLLNAFPFLDDLAALAIDEVDLTFLEGKLKKEEIAVIKAYVKDNWSEYATDPLALVTLTNKLNAINDEGKTVPVTLFPIYDDENIPGYEGVKPGYYDNRADAFRHAYVTARFSAAFKSSSWGLLFMAAHEAGENPNTGEAMAMDIHNNAIGAKIYDEIRFNLGSATESNIRSKVLDTTYKFVAITDITPEDTEDNTPLKLSAFKQEKYASAEVEFDKQKNQLVYFKTIKPLASVSNKSVSAIYGQPITLDASDSIDPKGLGLSDFLWESDSENGFVFLSSFALSSTFSSAWFSVSSEANYWLEPSGYDYYFGFDQYNFTNVVAMSSWFYDESSTNQSDPYPYLSIVPVDEGSSVITLNAVDVEGAISSPATITITVYKPEIIVATVILPNLLL